MNNDPKQQLLDKVVGQVFGYKNPFSIEQFKQKYVFDVRLPVQVNDSVSGESTWAQSVSSGKFITMKNARKMGEEGKFERKKGAINSIEDLLSYWENVNYVSTERSLESENIFESDNVDKSEFVYRSMDIRKSKNVLFCDGLSESEYVVASQRNNNLQYCIRVDDSSSCSNCFTITWSGKIINSMFISDCFDMSDCLFCTNVSSKQYWVANMPFEKEEYLKIKDMVVRWILTS